MTTKTQQQVWFCLSLAILILTYGGCRSGEKNSPHLPNNPQGFQKTLASASIAPSTPHSELASKPALRKVLLDIREPALLEQLEKHPQLSFSFGNILYYVAQQNTAPSEQGLMANASLYQKHPVYRVLAEQLKKDLLLFEKNVDLPMVKVNAEAKKFPAGNVGRLFDEGWFKSASGYFLLSGVVNRYDRKDFSQGSNCGEVRLIYRLAYKKPAGSGKHYASRLPFFLSFVFEYPAASDCAARLKAWQTEHSPQSPNFLPWLLEHPLNIKNLRFKQIELNAQVLRFPAGLMRETAGQALYLLKEYQFEKQGTSWSVHSLPLENTPDVRKLQKDPALKKELVTYIRQHLSEIDAGVFRLPDQFLAREAISFSTMGNMRLANKPFNAIFNLEELNHFSDLEFAKRAFIKSPQGLMERLNNATCMGCHQGNSTAGFHFLGQDRAGFFGVTNQLRLEVSPHYHADLQRRVQYFQDVVAGRTPLAFRPLSYAPAMQGVSDLQIKYQAAGINDFCLLKAEDDFSAEHLWSCASPEMECRELIKNSELPIKIGQCVYQSSQKEKIFAGLSCREGEMREQDSLLNPDEKSRDLPYNFFSFKDGFPSQQFYGLPENKTFTRDSYNCRPTEIGVPLGRTFRNCTVAEKELRNIKPGQDLPEEICAIVGGTAFDRCAEGNFHDCLSQIVVRGAVDTCSEDRFCREDYICQKLPVEMVSASPETLKYMEEKKVGFCTPTYFLYQMRLDGHVAPF